MVDRDEYFRVLEGAKNASQAAIDEHLQAFVQFLRPDCRERWLTLLRRRGSKLLRRSHKLAEAVDPSRCSFSSTPDVKASDQGLFFDFSNSLLWVSGRDAVVLGTDQDAIYSIEPGRRACLFWHEGGCWNCRAA